MAKDDLVYVGHMLDMAEKAVELDRDIVWDIVTRELEPLALKLRGIIAHRDPHSTA